ncbi:MAG TPA: hypothetical protein VGG06_28030 [Thermoanaerobaculia bacterium]
MRAGASGYLVKDSAASELLAAVRQRRLDLGPLAKSGELEVELAEARNDCVLVLAELGPADAWRPYVVKGGA